MTQAALNEKTEHCRRPSGQCYFQKDGSQTQISPILKIQLFSFQMSKKQKNSRKAEKNRRKHDQRRIEHNHHLKMIAAKKAFIDATRRILDALDIPDMFDSIPEKQVSDYYSRHVTSVRIVPAPDTKISRRVLTKMRAILTYFLKNSNLPLGKGTITLEDYMTAGMALGFFKQMILKAYPEIAQKLPPEIDMFLPTAWDIDKPPLDSLLGLSLTIENLFSRINGTIYNLNPDTYEEYGRRNLFSFSFVVYTQKAVIKQINVDGKFRPAYRAAYSLAHHGIIWSHFSKKELQLDCAGNDKKMDIYIQSHALIRMRERIDTFDHNELNVALIAAIAEKKITVLPNGNRLLICEYKSIKLGYFLLEIVDDIVLIKTFLFITHSGTPEGDRLDQELKIGKLEKQFTGIDKLSTFVHSDIMNDERVRNIFIKIGLGYLCDLPPDKFDQRKAVKKGYAADFVKYMNIGGKW
jgi:hypothetical protein